MANKLRKSIQYHILLGNYTLKQDTTIHLLKWTKSRILTTPNGGEGVKEQKLLFIAGGNAKR